MSAKAVIIPAAGSGTRLGSEVPKAFVEVSGKPILQRSIECFLGIEGLRQIIIPTAKDYIDRCKELCSDLESEYISFEVIEGGSERQYSIWNALKILHNSIELVAVHDAARPFLRQDYILRCFEVANEAGAAVLGVPVKDTIKRTDEVGSVEETPNRKYLWQAQTPQVFRKDLILEAYKSASANCYLGTDDSSLVERIGAKVKMIEGDSENLKITYPLDLKVAELIAKGWI